MKKRLNIENITNELEGASLFFQSPQPPTPLLPSPADEEGLADPSINEPKKQDDTATQIPKPELHSPTPPAADGEGSETRTPPTPVRSYVPYAVRPVRRPIRRWPYELYEDQIDTLREQAMEDARSGGRGSASAMVREAIDQWLAKNKKPKKPVRP